MNKLSSRIFPATLLALGMAAPAAATTVGFSLSINDPVFNPANGNLNVPDFQLENTSEPGSGLQISDFTLTIGDTNFNFDFVRIQTAFNDPGNDLGFTLNTVGTSNNGIGDDVLDYDFTGFDSGDIFRFEVDVDPDSGSPSQDFRAVLFPNAVLDVTFSDGTVLSQNLAPSSTSGSAFSFDEVAVVPLPSALALYLGGGLIGAGVLQARRQR